MKTPKFDQLFSKVKEFNKIYRKSPELIPLNELISVLEEGISNSSPKVDIKEKSRIFGIIGLKYFDRYLITNNELDITKGIQAIIEASTMLPNGDDNGGMIAIGLAKYLREENPYRQNLKIVQATLTIYDELIEGIDIGSDEHIVVLGNKANAYRQLYEQSSDPKYLDEAILTHEQALEFVQSDSDKWPVYISNYSNALRNRFSEYGNFDDLNKAIKLQKQAIESGLDPDNEDLIQFALCMSYLERHEFNGNNDDLINAYEAIMRSISLTKKDTRAIIPRLSTLGIIFLRIYKQNNDISIITIPSPISLKKQAL